MVAACTTMPVYYEYRSIDGMTWRKTDTLVYSASLPDTGQADLSAWIEIRHRGNYPYRNLSVRIARTLATSTDTTLQTDTLRLILANNEGQWYGKGLANIFQLTAKAGGLHTVTPATIDFKVTPALSDSLLEGISDIGIRLERITSSASHVPHPSAKKQKAKW